MPSFTYRTWLALVVRLAEHVGHAERLEQLRHDPGLVLRRDRPATRTADAGLEDGALHQHVIGDTSTGPVDHLCGRAPGSAIFWYPGRLDEHVAGAAGRVRPVRVRVGGGYETRGAAAELPHLLLERSASTSRSRSAPRRESARRTSGHGPQRRRGVPHLLDLVRVLLSRFLAWSVQPFSGGCSVPTTEERRTACLTGATRQGCRQSLGVTYRRHATNEPNPPTGPICSARVCRQRPQPSC